FTSPLHVKLVRNLIHDFSMYRYRCILCIFSTVYRLPNSPWTVLIAFLVFETSVGAYYPSMGTLKAEIVPEAYRATIYNLFRVSSYLCEYFIIMEFCT
ncbi:hypothetical protein Pmar_PMAR008384, partial [Perkinsus marinus ATCC 50983]